MQFVCPSTTSQFVDVPKDTLAILYKDASLSKMNVTLTKIVVSQKCAFQTDVLLVVDLTIIVLKICYVGTENVSTLVPCQMHADFWLSAKPSTTKPTVFARQTILVIQKCIVKKTRLTSNLNVRMTVHVDQARFAIIISV